MRKLISAMAILVASPASVLLVSAPAMAADQTIDAFEAGQVAAWNAHDAAAYSAPFDQHAEIITMLGWHWTGQAEAARNLGDGFKLVYARAELQISGVQIRNLTPGLASVTLSWSMAGARTIDGGQPAKAQHGFETQLLQRRGDSWVILAQQDTASSAPMPASARTPEPTTPAASTFPRTPPPVRKCIMARGNGDCLIYGKAPRAPAQ